MAKVVADHDDLQHIEGICKWVNSEQIFFWYQLLGTKYLWSSVVRVVKVDYLIFSCKKIEILVWIGC